MLKHSIILHLLGTFIPAGNSREKMSQKKTIGNARFNSCLLLIEEHTVKGGTFPESEIKQSFCAHLLRGCYYKKIMLLKRFLSYFQTSTRLFSELIKCSNHANSYELRYLSFPLRTPPGFESKFTSFSLSFCPRNAPLLSFKLPRNLSYTSLVLTIFIYSLTRCFNMLSPC